MCYVLGQVMLDFFALPGVGSRLSSKPGTVLTNVPVTTRKNVYLHPYHLSMDESAKYGQQGRWPSNVAIRTHFSSIVNRGYEAEKEALEVRFPVELYGQPLPMFSTEFIDGHAKSVMVQSVFALLDYLDS